jgi:hypothetical protein
MPATSKFKCTIRKQIIVAFVIIIGIFVLYETVFMERVVQQTEVKQQQQQQQKDVSMKPKVVVVPPKRDSENTKSILQQQLEDAQITRNKKTGRLNDAEFMKADEDKDNDDDEDDRELKQQQHDEKKAPQIENKNDEQDLPEVQHKINENQKDNNDKNNEPAADDDEEEDVDVIEHIKQQQKKEEDIVKQQPQLQEPNKHEGDENKGDDEDDEANVFIHKKEEPEKKVDLQPEQKKPAVVEEKVKEGTEIEDHSFFSGNLKKDIEEPQKPIVKVDDVKTEDVQKHEKHKQIDAQDEKVIDQILAHQENTKLITDHPFFTGKLKKVTTDEDEEENKQIEVEQKDKPELKEKLDTGLEELGKHPFFAGHTKKQKEEAVQPNTENKQEVNEPATVEEKDKPKKKKKKVKKFTEEQLQQQEQQMQKQEEQQQQQQQENNNLLEEPNIGANEKPKEVNNLHDNAGAQQELEHGEEHVEQLKMKQEKPADFRFAALDKQEAKDLGREQVLKEPAQKAEPEKEKVGDFRQLHDTPNEQIKSKPKIIIEEDKKQTDAERLEEQNVDQEREEEPAKKKKKTANKLTEEQLQQMRQGEEGIMI